MIDTSLCLGEFHLTEGEGLEGWCWYPEFPEERAIVELLMNGETVRAARATRFLQNRRDLGVGDGYCGFWFPIPAEIGREEVRVVLEVRERRFQQVFGRVVFGSSDRVRQHRLEAAHATLGTVGGALQRLGRAPRLGSSLEGLGQTLLHLAARPHERAGPHIAGLAACLERIAAVPAADLGWSSEPQISVIVPPPTGDIGALAATLRDASRAFVDRAAEFILLDDGSLPLTALLPTRLRSLQLIRTTAARCLGSSLNAAAVVCRGAFLAFAHPGGPSTAGLSEAASEARQGVLDIEAFTAAAPILDDSTPKLHRLQCVVSRDDFVAMGGFDPQLEGEAMWFDFVAKAEALGMLVRAWRAPTCPGIELPQATDHV